MLTPLSLTLHEDLLALPSGWDELATGRSPFLERGFLEALAASGSVGRGTGWQPLVLLARDAAGALRGAVPAFAKTHSYGEYIFDWAWAQGAQRAGIPYYPKLVVAAPFTPATGRRLLLRARPTPPTEVEQDEDRATERVLAEGLRELTARLGLSSAHVLFCTEEEERTLAAAGFAPRLSTQYHWRDQGFGGWEGFLASLKGKRRRAILAEQRAVAAAGIRVRMLQGPELGDAHWEAADAFYRHTCDRKWNDAYLRPGFFAEIRRRMPERFAFCAAERDGEVVAGASFFRKGDALFGRHWGRRDGVDVPGLHFDVCYHTPLRWALEQGIALVEAGAQGEHKVARGFEPVPIRSAHHVAHPALAEAVRRFVAEERDHTELVMEHLHAHGAYRREP